MLKFALVTSVTCSDLIAVVISVRFSAGGAAVAEVAALPVVVCERLGSVVCARLGSGGVLVWAFWLVCDAPLFSRLSAFMLTFFSRPSAFMLPFFSWPSAFMLP